MKTMRFNDSPDAPALLEGSAEKPLPGPGEILVRIRASGVTPSEIHWYPTTHRIDGSHRVGAIPGHEFSGIVEALGEDVVDIEIGDEVFGMNDWFAEGSTAEYCTTAATSVVTKPANLSHAEAASIPIGALTAWQGLFDRAKLACGETVLIHGGSGAVGVYAIQFAKRAGANVVVTASERDREFLQHLGAAEVIDYRTGRFEDHPGGFDLIFDGVGGETLQRSLAILNPDSRLVTIAADSEATEDQRVKAAFFIVEPNPQQLLEIAGLLESGELKAFVSAVFQLEEASAAYFGAQSVPKKPGKRVITIPG